MKRATKPQDSEARAETGMFTTTLGARISIAHHNGNVLVTLRSKDDMFGDKCGEALMTKWEIQEWMGLVSRTIGQAEAAAPRAVSS